MKYLLHDRMRKKSGKGWPTNLEGDWMSRLSITFKAGQPALASASFAVEAHSFLLPPSDAPPCLNKLPSKAVSSREKLLVLFFAFFFQLQLNCHCGSSHLF